MSSRPLKQEEIVAIFAVWAATGGDIHAHQPIGFIRRKFEKSLKSHAKKILEETARHPEQYIIKHKNRDTTYMITLAGIKVLEDQGMITKRRSG